MSLLDKLKDAVDKGIVRSPFTTNDIKVWIDKYNIINDTSNKKYKDSYIKGFASSSVVGSTSTKGDKKLRALGKNPEEYEFV